MSPDTIQTISDWLEPRKMKDIQPFLGFTNFYHHFIFNYSNIVVPLTWLTKKDTPWNFSEACHQSFNTLKKAFTAVPILTHFILNTPITVEMDASDYSVAGILSITCTDGEIHPVMYYSWTLTALKLNYNKLLILGVCAPLIVLLDAFLVITSAISLYGSSGDLWLLWLLCYPVFLCLLCL